MERDFPDRSRQTHYYQMAVARVWVALVESGLMEPADRVRGTRWPIPVRVMHAIGKRSRSDRWVAWLAAGAMERREVGWTSGQLLYWLRQHDAKDV
jgi:hypothetical protein